MSTLASRYHDRGPWDRLKRDPNLQRTLGLLLGLGVHASQRAAEQLRKARTGKPEKPVPVQPLPSLYSSNGGKTAGGIVKIVSGALLGCVTLPFAIVGMVLLFTGGGPLTFLLMLALLAICAGLVASGIRTLCLVSRFKNYCRALGQKTHCALDQLAQLVGRPEAFLRKDLKKMIRQGLFLEGHLDQEEATLITSHETYRLFEESRLKYEQQKQLEAQEQAAAQQRAKEEATRQAAEASARDPKVQAVLAQGEDFLRQLRQCNEAIPGQAVSGKISRMELIVQKIFHRLQADPDILDDLKKMMDYYLPMTIKLLRAYADMDAQPVQGETIAASKREIEEALDTMNLALERLLDSVFQETALDVSSDISVLQTLLAQEGLTEDPLAQMKKQPNL